MQNAIGFIQMVEISQKDITSSAPSSSRRILTKELHMLCFFFQVTNLSVFPDGEYIPWRFLSDQNYSFQNV